MESKYKNFMHFALAKLQRDLLRYQLKDLVSWQPLIRPEPGCTIIIGVCSKLPYILEANLTALEKHAWAGIQETLIVVDGEVGSLPIELEARVKQRFSKLAPRFLYYTPRQTAVANRILLPYVYCWMSWCVAFSQVKTDVALIHDYDALIVGTSMEERYCLFRQRQQKMQGVRWYSDNGILPSDRLSTTFEAFINVPWLREFDPVQLFNNVAIHNNRYIDYDILLDLQANQAADHERDIIPMDLSQLIHPSQMIHQYTMFRKFPGRPLPCFSIIMIPFFYFLSGRKQAFQQATAAIDANPQQVIHFLENDSELVLNLVELETDQVDWVLKQIIQAILIFKIPPFPVLIEYGNALYRAAKTPSNLHWVGSFTHEQQHWINAAAELN